MKNMPVRISAAALVITFGLILWQAIFLQKAQDKMDHVYNVELPVLQLVATAQRLEEGLYKDLGEIIKYQKTASLPDYVLARDILKETLDQITQVKDENLNDSVLKENIQKLIQTEREVLKKLRVKDYSGAGRSYEELYLVASENFRGQLGLKTEQISIEHENALNNFKTQYRLMVVASAVGIIFLIGIWVVVYFAFAKANKDREEAQHQLEIERAKMVSTSKLSSMGEMAGGIAHEINNPLAIIISLISQITRRLEQGNPDLETVRNGLQKISKTADRIAKIVNSLRVFARDGEHDPFVPVNIKHVLDEILSLSGEKFKSRGIDIRLKGPDEVTFECRQVQVEQVIVNLLNNAHDAIINFPEKWVEIEYWQEHGYLKIAVTDCGKGIPKDIAEKIMQPFFTTKEIGHGTGLGLSVSVGILKAHNGTLSLDDKCPNTRFVLTFPLVHPKTESTPAAA